MNEESQGKAWRALGALEAWIESAVTAEITGASAALSNLKTVETEFKEVGDLARRAQALFNA
jgi:hypothetical protein